MNASFNFMHILHFVDIVHLLIPSIAMMFNSWYLTGLILVIKQATKVVCYRENLIIRVYCVRKGTESGEKSFRGVVL